MYNQQSDRLPTPNNVTEQALRTVSLTRVSNFVLCSFPIINSQLQHGSNNTSRDITLYDLEDKFGLQLTVDTHFFQE